MYKAINNIKDQKGFTLIELLIVIAIIGILAAIAIPAFLGQREKAKIRSVEAGAKGAVAEVQSWLDAFVAGDPYLYQGTGDDKICVEATTPSPGKSCAEVYTTNFTSTETYAAGVDDIMADIINHHNNKGEKSPFDGNQPLFTTSIGTTGTVHISNIGTAIKIVGYGATSSALIFNTTVSAL